MEDYNEVLETEETQPTGVPDTVKVLAIISYIGHGFLIIIFLIAMAFFATTSGSNIARLMGSQVDGFLTILIVVFLLFIGFSVISIIGAAKMHKGKKIGFVLYAIGSGLLGLLFLLGAAQQPSNLILGLITIGLVVGFATQLKHLR
jgi:heme/copper-type cytochrome/quinol oxidase subunit 3